MIKLITGGTGLVGAKLAHIFVERGESVVIFDRTIKRQAIADIEDKLKAVQGNLANWSEVFNVVKDNAVTDIYHLGSMHSPDADINPWAAFQSNIIGTYNVLEAARLLDVPRVMFTSTLGTYGLELGTEVTDTTIQRPVHFYGVGKLYCEGIGRLYRSRFGIDFRGIRYPSVFGPGDKSRQHWWSPMIQDVVRGKPHECKVSPEVRAFVISYEDAARAADMVLQAPKEYIKMVNYNVAGVTPSISPQDVAQAIKKLIPDALITYRPAQVSDVQRALANLKVYDDTNARREWNWQPLYCTVDQMVASLIEAERARSRMS